LFWFSTGDRETRRGNPAQACMAGPLPVI